MKILIHTNAVLLITETERAKCLKHSAVLRNKITIMKKFSAEIMVTQQKLYVLAGLFIITFIFVLVYLFSPTVKPSETSNLPKVHSCK